MKKSFLTRRVEHILIPGLLALFASPGVASAAEESNWFESLLDGSKAIAAKLRVPLRLDPPAVEGSKRPSDRAQQVLRATYKVVNLQTRLGMAGGFSPNPPIWEAPIQAGVR